MAVFVQDNSGSLQTLPSGTLSSDVVLQSVNETNGFSVIESTEDFLGFNAGGLNQLFLVNTEGQVVHQYTNEATTVDFSGASVSADNLTIAFARITGVDKSVNTITSTVIGENPSVGVGATLETLALADTIFPVKINNI